MNEEKSPISIMTNEDPDETIQTLCKLENNSISWESYKKSYEKFFNNEQKISKQHNDAHFYLVRQLGLIERKNNSEYRLSPTGELFCEILQKTNHEKKFQKTLASLLLTNDEKGELFREFIDYVKNSKKDDDLKKKFVGETHRTLKSWSKRANLVTIHDDYCAAEPIHDVEDCTVNKFFKTLFNTYEKIQRRNVFEPKREYIPIREIKRRVSCELGFKELTQFDNWLTETLNHKKYRLFVRLHGAPSHAYEKMETFRYKGKSYPLLSVVKV